MKTLRLMVQKSVTALSLLAVMTLITAVHPASAFAEGMEDADSSAVVAKTPKKAKSSKKKNSSKAAKKASTQASGKTSSKTSSKSSAKAATGPKGKLSRDVVFDGSVVNGKYLASGEAVSTVENEKTLDNLIGMRADFKDRLGDQREELRSGSSDK